MTFFLFSLTTNPLQNGKYSDKTDFVFREANVSLLELKATYKWFKNENGRAVSLNVYPHT